jgi:hypothetical protein
MNRQNYKNLQNFSTSENFVNKNHLPKNKSNHGSFIDVYGVNNQEQHPAIIYPKQERICPKKGNNFFYFGVS